MKFTNIFNLLLAGAFVAGASSCVDEIEYTPAEKVDLADYYFSTGNVTQNDLDEGQTSFSVLLGRLNTEGEQTVPVKTEIKTDADTTDLFTIPKTVTFADGEGTALLTVTYDEAKLTRKVNYDFNFSLDGIQDTPYYLGNLNVTCIYNPWITLGKGVYTDVIIGNVFSLEGWPFTYGVTVQEHPDTKGFYRLVNPYAPGTYPIAGVNYGTSNYYVLIHAEDPTAVYLETSNIGFCGNPTYGRFLVSSTAYLNMTEEDSTLEQEKEAGNCGELEQGNVFIPAEKIEIAMESYQDGAWNFKNSEEFHLVLPGYDALDRNWETLGMCDFTDGFCGPFLTAPQDNHTYKVRVDINKKSPNIIRIVDPYGAEAGYPKSLRDPSKYITFDVANPNCIMLSDTITTVAHNRKTFGVVLAMTVADSLFQKEGWSVQEIIDEGIGGSFADSVITIPAMDVIGMWSNNKKHIYQETTDVVLDLRYKNRIPWEPATPAAADAPVVSKPMVLELRK